MTGGRELERRGETEGKCIAGPWPVQRPRGGNKLGVLREEQRPKGGRAGKNGLEEMGRPSLEGLEGPVAFRGLLPMGWA